MISNRNHHKVERHQSVGPLPARGESHDTHRHGAGPLGVTGLEDTIFPAHEHETYVAHYYYLLLTRPYKNHLTR